MCSNLEEVTMQKLAAVLVALLVVLLGMAPRPARAGDAGQAEVRRTVAPSTIAGCRTNNVGTAEWEPVVGQECQIENGPPVPREKAEGTVQAGTQPAPSDHLKCLIGSLI